MEVYVLNMSFETVAIVDSYTSLIWTDRFREAGDFELYLPMNSENLSKFVPDYYLWFRDSSHLMIIEDIKTTSDTEEGNNLTVTGRSLESILSRRVVWGQTEIKDNATEFSATTSYAIDAYIKKTENSVATYYRCITACKGKWDSVKTNFIEEGILQNGIYRLIKSNILSPTNSDRTISNFKFINSSNTKINSLKLDAQYNGETLYDIITDLCDDNKIGFKVICNSNHEFEFSLYVGEDHSFSQSTLPYVVFSPDFENIINSEYRELKSSYKSVAMVTGEGNGTAQKIVESPKIVAFSNIKTYKVGDLVIYDNKKYKCIVEITTAGEWDSSKWEETFVYSGLLRREIQVNANDTSTNEGSISQLDYESQLVQKGIEGLKDYKIEKAFEGEVETTKIFIYDKDYKMGDVVQFADEYGRAEKTRVIEYIYKQDDEGYSAYPTFEVVDSNE